MTVDEMKTYALAARPAWAIRATFHHRGNPVFIGRVPEGYARDATEAVRWWRRHVAVKQQLDQADTVTATQLTRWA